jgi:pimeloyl-ACP methyl ester carboxylesterase
VYFLIGRHDINAPTYLTEEYFKVLKAPQKEIIWFEHSGHNPWVDESEKFMEVIVNQILPETMQQEIQ